MLTMPSYSAVSSIYHYDNINFKPRLTVLCTICNTFRLTFQRFLCACTLNEIISSKVTVTSASDGGLALLHSFQLSSVSKLI